MRAKEAHKEKMLDYWGNPDNDFVSRTAMYSDVLGIAGPTFYEHFTPDEIQEIEYEAFENRKKNSTKERAAIYKTLAREGKYGNVSAAKEFLDRTEGKVIEKRELTGAGGKDLVPVLNVTVSK